MLAPEELDRLSALATELDGLLQQMRPAGDGAPSGPVSSDVERACEISALLSHTLTAASQSCWPLQPSVDEETLPLPMPPPKLDSIIMANPTGSKELILIADHEARVLRQTEAILTEDDYRVMTARDGFETIALYSRLWTAIDLVVLDFSLPGLSGDLIFDELLGINPTVAVVVSSGFHQPAKLSSMLAKGLCGFLPKPYDREKLLRQIHSVLANRRLR